jgi:hypothetical protein
LSDCANWTYFTNKNKCGPKCKIWQELEKQCLLNPMLLQSAKNIMKFAKINNWIGLDNIDKQYNIKEDNKYGQLVPIIPSLDMAIKELKQELREFYEIHIVEKLFKYQILK